MPGGAGAIIKNIAVSITTMSTISKILTVVVIAAIAAGTYYWYASKNLAAPAVSSEASATPGTEMTGADSGPSTLPSGTQTSNQALDQDLSSIDSQLSGLSSDTANASASLNDQQVPQSTL